MPVVPISNERDKRIEEFIVESFSKTTESDYNEKGVWEIKCPDDFTKDIVESLEACDYSDVIEDQGKFTSADTGYQWDPIYNAAIRCKQAKNVKYAEVSIAQHRKLLVNEFHFEVQFTN